MSSENLKNQMLVTETATIVKELSCLLRARKAIVPFPEKRLPYSWSPGIQDVSFLDLSHYQAIEEYSPVDQVMTVQCGMKLYDLERFLIGNKQYLPVAYPDEQTSLLDVILTGNAGPTEGVAGGLRRHVLGLTFMLSNGGFAKAGGKVVKNVSGYDLTRFLIGSYGHFALPVKANLRLYATPECTCTVVANSKHLQPLLTAINSLLSNRISFAYIDLLDKTLLPAKLSQLLTGTMTAVAGEGYCLVAQICGDQFTVDAEADLAKISLKQDELDHGLYTDISVQQELLTALTQIDACLSKQTERRYAVELSVGPGDFISICENKDLIAFPLLYRPVSGRLVFCLQSLTEQKLLLDLLDGYSKKNGKPLTVAYSDITHMRKMIKFGRDTTNGADGIESIKQRLKEQFDPDNFFNPFVSF